MQATEEYTILVLIDHQLHAMNMFLLTVRHNYSGIVRKIMIILNYACLMMILAS